MNSCDGCGEVRGEVRRLGTGGDSAIIVCWKCHKAEMLYRKARNRELSADCRFDLPKWEELEVYTGE